MREYLTGWDWSIAPWFVLSEEDARILNRVLEMYENTLEQKRDEARRRRKLKEQKLEEEYLKSCEKEE